MTVELSAVCVDAREPRRLAQFWAELLGRPMTDGEVCPSDGTGFRLRFLASDAPKTRQNQMHVDLTSASLDEQRATVDRARALGGSHVDVGQLPTERHVVLADPEGNEFCVIEPGNDFLAGCGVLGCLASDGSHEVGLFWHAALDWPLVWDVGEETAIQSPAGGSKISWGGSPVTPKTTKNRLHYDLTVDEADRDAEVARLISLGATLVDATHLVPSATAMADPDGNEFCVVGRR